MGECDKVGVWVVGACEEVGVVDWLGLGDAAFAKINILVSGFTSCKEAYNRPSAIAALRAFSYTLIMGSPSVSVTRITFAVTKEH